MPKPRQRALPPTRSRPGSGAAWLLAASLGLAAGTSLAAGYASLSQVEAASETRDYSQQVREKKFAADQQAYLRNILLPQLAEDANRAAIARTRQRIRELALRDAAKEVLEPVNTLLRDEMEKQAANEGTDPLVQVNAMLLIGELVGVDGKPWAGAVESLARAVGDQNLPLAVRVAALTGLTGHLAPAAAGVPEVTAIAGPAVAGLVTNPPDGDPVAARWLVARALDLLPAVTPPPAAVAATAAILADEQADADVRVRAAVALGKLAKPEAGIDAAAAVAQVRTLAITALAADMAAAEERRFAKKIGSRDSFAGGSGEALMPPQGPGFGGGGMFGGQFGGALGGEETETRPPDEDAVPPLACRREAWRLYVLAEAIKPARSGPGLADVLTGDAQAAAVDLAAVLRQSALDLDAQPDEQTLERALASLREAGGPAAGATGDGRPEPPPGGDEQPASPFDGPANQSPF